MKLRFVKFFTSRENEIEKKEEEEVGLPLRALLPPAGRGQSLCSTSSSLHRFCSLSLHPVPPARILRPSLPSATDRESNALQLSPPQLSRFSLPSS